ncbi:hypothetical protein Mmc1_3123 [Magnetococcus marinus MC-1]|uniref:Membrane fusion protein biotin-lipoyl like domain-containing protein n=1 Tax=Magnetococcus marinus (strain ATCC BAA-1437 / JCM 17883 / MC-1) TaxID=156889 RepID=A0LCC0_MAGMM|nr:hypothetical protein [Magnetococcus marinus]ABK45613.1 hypothetical protein Mmc1_3123 [Magnetococcus marinus MC-1]
MPILPTIAHPKRWLLAACVLVVVALPLPRAMPLPATLEIAPPQPLYAPAMAQITALHVTLGDWVTVDQPLITLRYDEPDHTINPPANAPLPLPTAPSQAAPATTPSTLSTITLHARHIGQIIQLEPQLQPGQWVAKQAPLLTLSDDLHGSVLLEWSTTQQHPLRPGLRLPFQSGILAEEPLWMVILPHHPDPAAMRDSPPQPNQARLAVRLEQPAPSRRMRGKLWLSAPARSILGRLAQTIEERLTQR